MWYKSKEYGSGGKTSQTKCTNSTDISSLVAFEKDLTMGIRITMAIISICYYEIKVWQ